MDRENTEFLARDLPSLRQPICHVNWRNAGDESRMPVLQTGQAIPKRPAAAGIFSGQRAARHHGHSIVHARVIEANEARLTMHMPGFVLALLDAMTTVIDDRDQLRLCAGKLPFNAALNGMLACQG